MLPLLRPGLAVVDVGCGPGAITLGLAERVAPGRVPGIDIDAGRIDAPQSGLRSAWQRHGRGDPEAGRKLPGLLAAAGFTGIAAHAEADADTGDAARARDYMLRVLGDPDLAALARRRGWATPAEIALSADAWADWATRPDAFAAFFWCTAVATKPAGGL